MAYAPVTSGSVIQAQTINNMVSGASWFSADVGTDGITYKVPFSATSTNQNTVPAYTDGLVINFRAVLSNVGTTTNLLILTTGGAALDTVFWMGGQYRRHEKLLYQDDP